MFTVGYETEYLTAKIWRRNKVNIFLHLVSGIVELKIDMKIGFRKKFSSADGEWFVSTCITKQN